MTTAKEKMTGKPSKLTALDHDGLEAVYLANDRDMKRTSEQTGVKINTLYVIAKRKGWSTPMNAVRKIKEGKRELDVMQPGIVNDVTDAIKSTFSDQREGFRSSMSSALHRTGEYISTLPGDAILSESRRVKDILDSGAKLYGFGDDNTKAQISVNVLGLSLDGFSPMPTISL